MKGNISDRWHSLHLRNWIRVRFSKLWFDLQRLRNFSESSSSSSTNVKVTSVYKHLNGSWNLLIREWVISEWLCKVNIYVHAFSSMYQAESERAELSRSSLHDKKPNKSSHSLSHFFHEAHETRQFSHANEWFNSVVVWLSLETVTARYEALFAFRNLIIRLERVAFLSYCSQLQF